MASSQLAAAATPGLRLSVVIAAWNGVAALESCVGSLEQEGRGPDTEIIVVTNFNGGVEQMLRSRFSHVRHQRMPEGTPVPVLRTAGIHGARGEIIALAEDHCTFGKEWCSEVKKAHKLSYGAIGGAVENASVSSALDWAVYFYDYGKFMLPFREGMAQSLSGNNVSFKREVLCEVEPTFEDGFFEPFTHGAIVERGHGLYLAPSVVVYHQKNYRAKAVIAHCYHLARSYAAKRAGTASPLQRGMLIVGSCALPLLLSGRIIIRTLRKRRNIAALGRSLPYLLLLLSSWSWGEFCGYVAGEGHSASEWK